MAKLPKYELDYNAEKNRWDLSNTSTDKTVKSFENKADALKGGVLEKALGPEGGSVRIKKQNHRVQEERTYPGSRDPRRSKG